jgi:hypothetical protein
MRRFVPFTTFLLLIVILGLAVVPAFAQDPTEEPLAAPIVADPATPTPTPLSVEATPIIITENEDGTTTVTAPPSFWQAFDNDGQGVPTLLMVLAGILIFAFAYFLANSYPAQFGGQMNDLLKMTMDLSELMLKFGLARAAISADKTPNFIDNIAVDTAEKAVDEFLKRLEKREPDHAPNPS